MPFSVLDLEKNCTL